MQSPTSYISSLTVKTGSGEILRDVDLPINLGEVHVVMGPNGSGKSTLAQSIAGNPIYEVVGGDILFDGQSILGLTPDERARLGIYVSFQHPPEIPGVNVASYLRLIYNKRLQRITQEARGMSESKENSRSDDLELTDDESRSKVSADMDSSQTQNLAVQDFERPKPMSPVKFRAFLREKMELLDMKENFLDRYLNEGFSGGEKKKMELLQMLVLEPRLVILDEIDSGLDIDALKCVGKAINYLRQKNPQTYFIIITHHARILDHVRPDFVHIMKDGSIVKSGGFELAQELEKTGYQEFGDGGATDRNDIDGMEINTENSAHRSGNSGKVNSGEGNDSSKVDVVA